MLTSLAVAVAVVSSVAPVSAGVLTYDRVTINNAPGDQRDPHVNGNLAAYTTTTPSLMIRYFEFTTGADLGIPNLLPDGGTTNDSISDVENGRVVFTRQSADRDAVMLFDTRTTELREIDPVAGSKRRGVSVGGDIVAYADFDIAHSGFENPGEIVVHNVSTGLSTRLTDDLEHDLNPRVSPDGMVVTWLHCATSFSNCDVYAASRASGAWQVSAVAASNANDSDPDTNGAVVTYDSNRAEAVDGADVFWVSIGQGPAASQEQQLALPGLQVHPAVAGGVIAFESLPSLDPTDHEDLFLYEISTNRLFQITDTPYNERLNDVTVLPTGEIRLVWQAEDSDDFTHNIYAATFRLPPPPPPPDAGTPADGGVCVPHDDDDDGCEHGHHHGHHNGDGHHWCHEGHHDGDDDDRDDCRRHGHGYNPGHRHGHHHEHCPPVCLNRTVTLTASRSHSHGSNRDDSERLRPPMRFALPGQLTVTQGFSGREYATLHVEHPRGNSVCWYQGNGSSSGGGDRYLLVGCNGPGRGWHAGTIVTGTRVTLRVAGGDCRRSSTVVTVTLTEACTDDFTASSEQGLDSVDSTGQGPMGCSTLPGTAMAALVGFVVLARRKRASRP